MTGVPRPQDPRVTDALLTATAELLAEEGFAGLSLEAVARRAGVGRPAIYRRFAGKPELVAAAVAGALPAMEPADGGGGDTRAELRAMVDRAFPRDATSYVALLGTLIAEHRRHPELIAAFRERVLLPRRAIGRAVLERAVERGDLRADLDLEAALDLLAGPLLARVFAGLDVGPAWRDEHFARWWEWAKVA
jgi:AcrR family transcriptional regulator